jgi:hypothetical protein
MWRRSKYACLRATQFAKLLFSPHLADSSYLHISTGGQSKTYTYIEIEIEIERERLTEIKCFGYITELLDCLDF